MNETCKLLKVNENCDVYQDKGKRSYRPDPKGEFGRRGCHEEWNFSPWNYVV